MVDEIDFGKREMKNRFRYLLVIPLHSMLINRQKKKNKKTNKRDIYTSSW